MANYYSEFNKMINSLEDLIIKSDGISRDQLFYLLTKKYRVGSMAIKKRIDLLLRLEMIEEQEEVLRWVGHLTQK